MDNSNFGCASLVEGPPPICLKSELYVCIYIANSFTYRCNGFSNNFDLAFKRNQMT